MDAPNPASRIPVASRYRRAPWASLPGAQGAAPTGQGLFTGFPKTGFIDGDDRISQVPGGPHYERALLSDPGGTSALGHNRALVSSSAKWTASTPTTRVLESIRRKDIRAIARSSIVCRSNSLPCRLSLHAVEQGKRSRHYSFQQRPLWADSCEDAYPHQDAQQVPGKGLCRERSCDRAISLPGLDTTEKELLDSDEDGGEDPLKARVIRRDVERRIHKHAAFMLAVVERSADDLGEEGANCLARRQRLAVADAIRTLSST